VFCDGAPDRERTAESASESPGAESYGHEPVLVEPILKWLDPRPGQVILDGTVGLGGHAAAIVPRLLPGGRYIGLDIDAAMLAVAEKRLSEYVGRGVELVHASYVEFPDVLARCGLQRVEGMLLDLGANSAQLADPARGFSFEREGPLDMRFDARQKRTALDLVNSLSESELADLFYELGQEMASRKIAKRICQVRHSARITTTRTLARAVESVMGPGGKIHPATRVFQALRIAVNSELDNLDRVLQQVEAHLSPGGKLAVISFHSLEDGAVKRFLREAEKRKTMKQVTDRPVTADDAERQRNPRSRSAKLRVATRLAS
jgi:16S rRNA (cytosine1402-N4)-methyltransferase